jgi:fibronectin-binding autotransporter adhesin
MKATVALLAGLLLITTPASAVIITTGTSNGIYSSAAGTASIPYSLAGSGNALVIGSYIDNNFTASNFQFGGVAANGFVQDGRTVLAYFFNPAASGNLTFDVTAGSANSAYFIYELSGVDISAGANTGIGSSITTTADNRFIANFAGANNTDGAALTPLGTSLAQLTGVGNANGGIGGGSVGAASAAEGTVGPAGVKALGWTGFGTGFQQGEVSVAFSATPGGPVPWNVNGGGSWNTGSNWAGGSPPSAGGEALLGSVLTSTNAPANITLNSAVNVGRIVISNANRYNITGPQNLTLSGAAEISVGSGTHGITTGIAGSAGLNKTGGGTLVLSGTNTYTGGTNVQAGILQLNNAASAGGATTLATGAQLAFGAGYNGAFAGDISGAGNVLLDASLTTETVTFSGAKTYAGTTQLTGGTLAINNAAGLGAGDSTPATGTTIGTNGGQGSAKLAISGNVNIAGELLTLFPRRGEGIADLIHVTSAGSNTWGGNIKGDVNGDNYNFESTSGTLTLSGTISAPDGGDGIRNFVFKGAGNTNVTGRITDFETDANGNRLISSLDTQANVFVYKQGTGKLTIGTATSDSADFWRGGTFIEQGTLEVLAGGGTAGELWGPIELRSGATFDVDNFTTYAMSEGSSLSGGGTIQASTFKVFADNSLSPGDGVGTLTINGNVQISDEFETQGGILSFELGNTPATIGGTENDLIQVNGSLTTIGSPDMTVRVIAAEGGLSAGQYRLISHSGGAINVSGMAPAFLDALGNALTARQSLAVTSVAGQVNLVVTGEAASLTWTGDNGTAWDKNATQNWTDGGSEVFFDQDQVTFDDSAAPPIAGDFNNDSAVNLADYTVWRDNLGGSFDLGGNGDEAGGSAGIVDAADYALWKANFGSAGAGVTVNIAGEDVYPSLATFTSAIGNRYTITGTNGFGGDTPINLTGNVTVALQNPNTLEGTVTIGNNATLELGGGSTVNGNITGSGTLIVNGGATLNGASTFTGPISLSSITFIANAQALGTTDAGTTINAGGNLWFNFQNVSNSEALTFNGGVITIGGGDADAVTLTGAINVAAGGGTFAVNGSIGPDALVVNNNISGSAGGQVTANVGPNSVMTVNGNITNNGNLTKLGTGTLAIGATSNVTSPQITVNGGVLDVSAKASFELGNGQLLTGSFGTVTGDVQANSGSTIRVGGAGLQSGTIYHYTDANFGATGNTTLADGSVFTPTFNAGFQGASATWIERGGFANGGDVLQGQLGTNTDNAPTLRTTVGGLNPGQEYEIFVHYWTDGGGWQIQAGDSAGTLAVYNVGNSTAAGTLTFDSLVLTAEGNRAMLGAPLTLTANASGQIEVYIDENSANSAPRTWYDGISIASETVVGSEFTINGDLTLNAGSTLSIDIGTPAASDLLTLTGNLIAGGTLEVLLNETVADPIAGDVFDILDFAGASGAFNTLALPTLTAGLAWDTSNLLTTGQLAVVAGAGSLTASANVPEPMSVITLAAGIVGLGWIRSRSRKGHK